MDLMAIVGVLVFIVLAWWVLQQFAGNLPPLIHTICVVVLVIICVLVLCAAVGIPLPGRIGLR